jgi:hypothetical protein
VKRPTGYVGLNHTTVGSDILAVVGTIHAPELTLGADLAARLKDVKADQWYPIDLLLSAFEALDQRLGRSALVSVGWTIFNNSHAATVKGNARSARDIVYGIDGMYHAANRGHRIGGWKVLRFDAGEAELEKTTPHHCVVEEGILQEGLRAMGVPAEVGQTSCIRDGAEVCRYLIRSSVTDQRWGGTIA